MKTLDIIAAVLLVVGGLNWGLWGLFKFDLVAALLGGVPALMNAVYVVVGLAAVYQALGWKRIQMRWQQPQTVRVEG
jgi:uncharacterized membrane protein YuzA (DUF378 family)